MDDHLPDGPPRTSRQHPAARGAAARGADATPSRTVRCIGSTVVEIWEEGHRVWHLSEAAALLAAQIDEAGGAMPNVTAIRRALRQSPEGFAALLGIPVETLRAWEQDAQPPRGAARTLLDVALRHPEVLLDTMPGAP